MSLLCLRMLCLLLFFATGEIQCDQIKRIKLSAIFQFACAMPILLAPIDHSKRGSQKAEDR